MNYYDDDDVYNSRQPEQKPERDDEEDDRQICPDCNGTNVDYIAGTGGSCPSCFGGYIR